MLKKTESSSSSSMQEEKTKKSWTTWEELLLTCAVKRYGLDNWSAIATELQTRVSTITAQICRNKYDDLKLRFALQLNDAVSVDSFVDRLRKQRIDELKRKVLGHDREIQNLEKKAKRLEEERDENPDLERSENDKNNVAGPPVSAGVSISDERENQSVEPDPGSESKPARAGSWNGSSKPSEEEENNNDNNNNNNNNNNNDYEKKIVEVESAELRDSATGDMHSSASLTKSGESPVAMKAGKKSNKKPEELVVFMDMVRSHKYGSVFEMRLDSQKSDEYKSLVKQHVDLETVQTRIENGSYSSCTTKFYLDLLLLVNNAIIFFPKASSESVAAFELRKLVLKDMKKQCIDQQQSNPLPKSEPPLLNPKPDLERSNSLLAKHKSSTPLIVCRKRSSIACKPARSNKVEEKPVIKPKPPVKSSSSSEEEISLKLKLKEKPVTGARSMRRSGNGRTNNTTITSTTNKVEAPNKTAEQKKTEVISTAKKRGAADFLKRIKKISPAKGAPLLETLNSSPENSSESGKRESRDRQKKRVVDDHKERAKGDGGGKKPVKEENSPSKKTVGRPAKGGKEATAPGKRGREVGGEADTAAKRPKKRTRK